MLIYEMSLYQSRLNSMAGTRSPGIPGIAAKNKPSAITINYTTY